MIDTLVQHLLEEIAMDGQAGECTPLQVVPMFLHATGTPCAPSPSSRVKSRTSIARDVYDIHDMREGSLEVQQVFQPPPARRPLMNGASTRRSILASVTFLQPFLSCCLS